MPGNWKSALLNNPLVKEEITEKKHEVLKTEQNENTICQNMWDATKSLLWEKFTALNAFITKQERTKTNELSFQLKKLEKEQLSKLKELRKK